MKWWKNKNYVYCNEPSLKDFLVSKCNFYFIDCLLLLWIYIVKYCALVLVLRLKDFAAWVYFNLKLFFITFSPNSLANKILSIKQKLHFLSEPSLEDFLVSKHNFYFIACLLLLKAKYCALVLVSKSKDFAAWVYFHVRLFFITFSPDSLANKILSIKQKLHFL